MKITKEQARAIFSLFQKQLQSSQRKEVRLIEVENRKLEVETFEKFKLTPEYSAMQLLSKSFPGTDLARIFKSRYHIEQMAIEFFKIKFKDKYAHSYFHNEIDTINLLAIDCKSLVQLKEAVSKHYNVKIK